MFLKRICKTKKLLPRNVLWPATARQIIVYAQWLQSTRYKGAWETVCRAFVRTSRRGRLLSSSSEGLENIDERAAAVSFSQSPLRFESFVHVVASFSSVPVDQRWLVGGNHGQNTEHEYYDIGLSCRRYLPMSRWLTCGRSGMAIDVLINGLRVSSLFPSTMYSDNMTYV